MTLSAPRWSRPRPSVRDRRGHGLRGRLVTSDAPVVRSRAEAFDDLVLDAVEQFGEQWETEMQGIEFVVEDVPEIGPAGAASGDLLEDRDVPLSRIVEGGRTSGGGSRTGRIIIYRRPLEARAADRLDLAELVSDVVIEQVARLLNLDPEQLDRDE